HPGKTAVLAGIPEPGLVKLGDRAQSKEETMTGGTDIRAGGTAYTLFRHFGPGR
ncbi:unnamed protein product, partial [marine sediment metagenome]